MARASRLNRCLVAQIRHRHINDVGIEHREQRRCHAVGDLLRIIVLPDGRQIESAMRSRMQRLSSCQVLTALLTKAW